MFGDFPGFVRVSPPPTSRNRCHEEVLEACKVARDLYQEKDDRKPLQCRYLNEAGEELVGLWIEDYRGVMYRVGPDNTIYSKVGKEIGKWTEKGPELEDRD